MWFNKDQGGFLIIIDGEKIDYKNLMVLDYPGSTSMFSGTISSGDFGPVPPEYLETTGGVENYNIMMDFNMMKIPGVLHESGTRIFAKSFFPGKSFFYFIQKRRFKGMKNRFRWGSREIIYYLRFSPTSFMKDFLSGKIPKKTNPSWFNITLNFPAFNFFLVQNSKRWQFPSYFFFSVPIHI